MPDWPASISTAACPSCCGEPATLECRTRGGTATLCGWSEYSSPSTPPKKYRTQVFNEDFTFCLNFTGANCTGNSTANRDTMTNATAEYSAVNCTITNTNTTRTFYGSGASGACPQAPSATPNTDTPGLEDNDYSTGFNFDGMMRTTDTPTQIVWQTDNSCYSNPPNGAKVASGSISVALSNEATEAEAITRFQTATSWGAWQTVGGGCSVPDCCLAKYEPRTAGFSLAYQDAEFRVTETGLTPGGSYEAIVAIYRRTYGSGTYALYQTIVIPATADGSGEIEVTDDVPNDRGYETYAAWATVQPA